jgi:hypothetical protein
MKTRPYLLLVLFFLSSVLTSIAQTSVQPITGWNMEEKDGSYVFKPEKTPGDIKEFVYEIMAPSKNIGQAFDDWFSGTIDYDLQQAGFSLPGNTERKNITTNHTISSFSAEVTDKKGKGWYVTYISYQTNTNDFRFARVVSSTDIKFYASNMRPVANHFGNLAKQDGGGARATRTSVAVRSDDNIIVQADNTGRKGLKTPDINGILIHLEYNYAPDGKMLRTYYPYLVLNDGSIYSEPVTSPYVFDVNLSKQNEAKKWGSWKLRGNSFIVEWNGRNETEKWYKNWFWATPSISNERIEGSFMTVAGKGNDALKISGAAPKTITFTNDGQFTISSVTDATGHTPASEFSKRNESGTYLLNDYSIELRFNNGTVLRQTFYFYLQGKTHFGIGNYVYVPKRNDQ